MFNATGGESILVHDLLAEVGNVEGITILGGEPLQQLPAVAELAAAASRRGLGVIVFTGYTLERARPLPGFDRLWSSIDTLVDGPFDARSPEPADGRRVIGSTNQGLRHRTDRYRDPADWCGPGDVEVRISGNGAIEIVGPARPAGTLARSIRDIESPPWRRSSTG